MEKHPAEGRRVRLIELNDSHNPMEPGELGTVSHVDAAGTYHVNWDNGRKLGLILGLDKWEYVE